MCWGNLANLPLAYWFSQFIVLTLNDVLWTRGTSPISNALNEFRFRNKLVEICPDWCCRCCFFRTLFLLVSLQMTHLIWEHHRAWFANHKQKRFQEFRVAECNSCDFENPKSLIFLFGDGTAGYSNSGVLSSGDFFLTTKKLGKWCNTTKPLTWREGKIPQKKDGRKRFGGVNLNISRLVCFTQMIDIKGTRGRTDKKLWEDLLHSNDSPFFRWPELGAWIYYHYTVVYHRSASILVWL